MKTFLEVDENGVLQVPADFLPKSTPHSRYSVERQESTIILSPESASDPFWKSATPSERSERFLHWAKSHSPDVGLSDTAVSRDDIYD